MLAERIVEQNADVPVPQINEEIVDRVQSTPRVVPQECIWCIFEAEEYREVVGEEAGGGVAWGCGSGVWGVGMAWLETSSISIQPVGQDLILSSMSLHTSGCSVFAAIIFLIVVSYT